MMDIRRNVMVVKSDCKMNIHLSFRCDTRATRDLIVFSHGGIKGKNHA